MRCFAMIRLKEKMLVIEWKQLTLGRLKFVDLRQREPPCNDRHYNQEKSHNRFATKITQLNI